MYKLILRSLILTALWAYFCISTLNANPLPARPLGPGCGEPTNFHVTNIGTSFADLAWDASTQVQAYLLRIIDVATQQEVYQQSLPGTASSANVSGLQSGWKYKFLLTAICQESGDNSKAAEADGITLVLDLVVVASPPGTVNEDCELQEDELGPCGNFPWESTTYQYFSIKYNPSGVSRLFRMRLAGEGSQYCQTQQANPLLERLGDNAGDNYFRFYASNGSAPPTCAGTVKIKRVINGSEQEICTLDALTPSLASWPNGRLYVDQITSGYSIHRVSFTISGGERGDDSSWTPIDNPWATNPFTDELEVNVPGPENASGPLTIDLFDLEGRRVAGEQYAQPQSQAIIPTAELSPGVYFLRIAAGGQVTTLKVIKSR